jgi:hypothetical protein
MRDDFRKGLKRFSIFERPSLVSVDSFATPEEPTATLGEVFDRLPDTVSRDAFVGLVGTLRDIVRRGGGVAMAFGAHVIKTGLSPVVIDLIERGLVTSVAGNGACAVHDYEIAFAGKTSEDVAEALPAGRFGMARETAEGLGVAARIARETGEGYGAALGRMIVERDFPHADKSIFAAAARAGVPATLHVAIGTDVVHMHPEVDGADVGAASMADFQKVCRVVGALGDGAWLNVGSAVILPEVFLKAVSVSRNLGADLDAMVTANFDMFDLYRPRTNVVGRPSAKGFMILGRHEIMLPLLRAALLARE